jgi:hypothetical protein
MGDRRYGSPDAFGAIDAPHAAMHEAVRRGVAAHNAGNRSGASAALDAVRRSSAEVIRCIDELERVAMAGTDVRAPVVQRRRPSDWSRVA